MTTNSPSPDFLIPMHEHIDKIILAAAPRINIEEWREPIITSTREWNIYDERFCMFLAQIAHESNDMNRLSENLNYSVEALLSLFGRHRISEADADKYGRKAGQPANQQMLANILYGGEWGRRNLGNIHPNDGWDYRGQGPKQITGRYNYQVCGEAIGKDLVKNPSLLSTDKYVGMKAACWYFSTRTKGIDIVQVTRQINGGTIGLEDRRVRFERALSEYNKLKALAYNS